MTTARAVLDHEMSEAELQDAICEMATRLGWRWNHNPDSRRSNPGLPDLILIHPEHGVLWLELKVQDPRKGRVRKEQQVWLNTLRTAGQRAWVIRPADMDFVERLLRGAGMTLATWDGRLMDVAEIPARRLFGDACRIEIGCSKGVVTSQIAGSRGGLGRVVTMTPESARAMADALRAYADKAQVQA